MIVIAKRLLITMLKWYVNAEICTRYLDKEEKEEEEEDIISFIFSHTKTPKISRREKNVHDNDKIYGLKLSTTLPCLKKQSRNSSINK